MSKCKKSEYIPVQAYTKQQELNFKSNGYNSRKFHRFIQILNQYIGLLKVEGNDEFIRRQNTLFECCYLNGKVVLTFIKNKLQIWSPINIKYDINGEIESVSVLPYISYAYNQINSQELKEYRFRGDECVVIQANPQGYGLWFLWNQIINDNLELFDIYMMNAKLNVKKLMYVVNNESDEITDMELESITSPDSPIVKVINPISQIGAGENKIDKLSMEQNQLLPLDLSAGNYSFDDVMNHWIFELNLMGLFADEYHKKERNTEGENEFTQANTIILHDVLLREFKAKEKEINSKFRINVKFSKTIELKADTNNSEETNNETKSDIH